MDSSGPEAFREVIAMYNDEYKWMKKYSEELQKDPSRLKAFMRSVMGPPRRTLVGTERDNILLILSLKDPISESNNQHTWTSVYEHDGKEYHVTSFPGGAEDAVEEMLPDDQ